MSSIFCTLGFLSFSATALITAEVVTRDCAIPPTLCLYSSDDTFTSAMAYEAFFSLRPNSTTATPSPPNARNG